MAKWKSLLCSALIMVSMAAFGQTDAGAKPSPSLFSLTLSPALDIPVGRAVGVLTLGGGADLSAAYRMPFLPLVFVGGRVGYSFAPLKEVTSLSVVNGGLDAGVHIDIINHLSMRAFGTLGYFYGFLNDGSGGGANPFMAAGANISYEIMPALNLGVGLAYRSFFGLHNDFLINLGASYNFAATKSLPTHSPAGQQPMPAKPAPIKVETKPKAPEPPKSTGLDIIKYDSLAVFPVSYKYYTDHPVGKAVLHNWEKTAAENIKVSFLMKQYMDNAQPCAAPPSLAPGEEKEIELSGLFKSTILEISEPTLVSANITIEYTLAGKAQRKELTQAVRVYDRNAMTWEDDRRAAAFVTAKDPTVLKFSKNITSMLKGKASNALNAKLLTAIGMHEALSQYGLNYVVDPTTPYSETSKNKQAVDFLQFPQQTLEYKAGDCDDLSILYCALLESVGVETAFITIPGHIYMAFSLDMNPEEARKAFLHPDDLIFNQEKGWIPIEVTQREGGFLKAWDSGAKEWRENKKKGQATFYPIHDCWKTYESVGFSGVVVPITLPPDDRVVKSYVAEVTRFIDGEIYAQVAALQGEIQKAKDPSNAINKLGVLYAQHGLNDRAEREFARLVDKEYVPALVNMGNILSTRNDFKGALAYYERARKKEPNNPRVLLCVARANHELENYGQVREAYDALKILDPDLAARFAYLDLRGEEASRAADLSQAKSVVIWEVAK